MRVAWVIGMCLVLCGLSSAAEDALKLTLRSRVEKDGRFEVVATPETWQAKQTAIIICDMWDRHWCKGATARVGELAPRLNAFAKAARDRGVLIIHAPSSCMAVYKDHPGRKLAQAAPTAANLPKDIGNWCKQIPAEEKGTYPIDQSDGGCDCEPKCKTANAWSRQIDAIGIADHDAISDSGVEVWNLLEQRGIRNVILAGVHTNMCVLGRPFGLRQLARHGKHVILARDLTDTMYNSKAWPHVSHFRGTALIIEHIEKFVCPTMTSNQLLGGEPFRFAAQPPVNIILDTDVDRDCDDIGALFILHAAVERGEANLLATMGCTSSSAIAPALDAMNTWFGRPDIPVGTLKDRGFLDHKGFGEEIIRRYPHRLPSGTDYPDAVVLYRQVLAKQPDGSVVVLAVGPLRNLGNLLRSGPDAASPLDGRALVAKKVKRLEIMGGNYPPFANKKDAEWNFKQDPAAASLVCANWPTPILFNGEGGSTCSGRRVTYEMPEHNPLTMAYRHYPGVGFAGDRLSWDPISALVAVRGAGPWYQVVSGGTNATDAATGINTWQPGEDRGHSYLVLKASKPIVEKAIEDMMVAGKGRPTNLTFNTAYYAHAGMGQITSHSAADAGAAAIKAFDGDEKTAWIDKAASSWIQCQHADGRKYLVTSHAVVARDKSRLPRTLELSGSSDGGASWTVLDTQNAPDFTAASRREFTIARPAKWNLYRLNVTAANEKEGISISTIELNEAINCRPGVAVATMKLDHQAITIPANGRATLNATITPMETQDREVIWTSSDPAVAEVRRIGEQIAMVAGRKPGACTITATIGNVKQTCTVTVTSSTLPAGWNFDELNAPPIPGSVTFADGKFGVTGCGHAMTSWWERIRDQGVFVSKPMKGDVYISARLTSLAPNVGGPAYQWDNRPPTASGLMIRESLAEKCGRYVLIQVDASGNLVCRWRNKSGDQDDNQKKDLGKVTLPVHLKLVRTGEQIRVFASADGDNWGEPRMTHAARFDEKSRIGMFVCSGNTFSSTTAEFDSVQASE